MSLLFTTANYTYLKSEILHLAKWQEGLLERTLFPDGEIYHRILSPIENKSVILLGGTYTDAETLELIDLALGFIQQGVSELKIVIPYFGYATMERAVKTGEIVKAKTRASLFSLLVPSSTRVKIYLFDLHTEGIPYYFELPLVTHHVYCKKLIASICSGIASDFVLAATDAGRAKWVESLAQDMHVESAYVFKNRINATTTDISGIHANVKNKVVIIYDDMIRSGTTLMKAAEAYHKSGASRVFAVCTHGVFCNQALEKMKLQGIIQAVHCTNSNPISQSISNEFVKIHSLAGIIFEAVGE